MTAGNLQGREIWVVDDTASTRFCHSSIIRKAGGNVREFKSPDEVWREISKPGAKLPDAILTDYLFSPAPAQVTSVSAFHDAGRLHCRAEASGPGITVGDIDRRRVRRARRARQHCPSKGLLDQRNCQSTRGSLST